jgi:hypothetical protein
MAFFALECWLRLFPSRLTRKTRVTRRNAAWLPGEALKPSSNIAKPATGCRRRDIADIFRCRDWRDSSRNISRTSFVPLSSPIMINVARVLSPSIITGLTAHFRSLDPGPIGHRWNPDLGTGCDEESVADGGVGADCCCW